MQVEKKKKEKTKQRKREVIVKFSYVQSNDSRNFSIRFPAILYI